MSVIGFDREHNLVLINTDDIVLDEHFRMDLYHNGMDMSGLSRNINGVVIEQIVSFVSQFSRVVIDSPVHQMAFTRNYQE